jgi:hypothetical protein
VWYVSEAPTGACVGLCTAAGVVEPHSMGLQLAWSVLSPKGRRLADWLTAYCLLGKALTLEVACAALAMGRVATLTL